MIQLHPDCLMLQMASGESIPCCAELVTVELMGEGGLTGRGPTVDGDPDPSI